MGPTNISLVRLSQADKAWRDAGARLDAASHSVRVQERRLAILGQDDGSVGGMDGQIPKIGGPCGIPPGLTATPDLPSPRIAGARIDL